MHVAEQARSRITTLVNAVPALTGNVFQSKVYQIPKEKLPAAVVMGEGETVEPVVKGRIQPALQKRMVKTSVFLFARNAETVEADLLALVAAVETAIFSDPTLQGVAVQTTLESREPFIGSEPSLPVGAMWLTFASVIYTKEGLPEQAIQQ